jgi:hypothetical protein
MSAIPLDQRELLYPGIIAATLQSMIRVRRGVRRHR